MKEIEVKVLDIDKQIIEQRLKKLGAELIKDEFQTNVTYDSKDRKLKKNYNGYIRIRITEDNINNKIIKTMTFKKNIPDGEVRNNIEYETQILNEVDADQIIKHLGYDKCHKGTKYRKSYKYGDILFEIDTWDKNTYPSTYMEIEVNNKDDIEKALRLLEIDKSKVTNKSLEQLRYEIGM